MISFVVPAHNEEACLPQTLQAIHDSARATGQEYEIIVVNDASTDRTAEIARQHHARVIDVTHRQIAATRNSGASAACGERIFFVDADTTINPRAVAAALRCMDRGAVGGGAHVRFEGPAPLYIQILLLGCYLPAKFAGFCGGAFMFSTAAAYHASGGFDERLFWAEEGSFAFALKRFGRFEVIWPRIVTSSRRLRANSGLELLSVFSRGLFQPKKLFTQRASVQKIWYNSNRAEVRAYSGVRAGLFNAIALLITLSLVTGPVWNFVPWSQTPLSTPFGKIRFINAIFLCHVGLVFWPVSFLLLSNWLRQKFTAEWIKMALLVGLCSWQAWESSVGVIYVWGRLYHFVAG